jgi:hypothetical protein
MASNEHDAPGSLGLPGAQAAPGSGALHISHRRGHGVRPDPAQRLEPAVLRRPVTPQCSRIPGPVGGIRDHRRGAAGAERRAALVRRDPETEAPGGAGAGPGGELDGAGPGVSSGECRRDGHQPRSTHARGRPPPRRAFGGSGNRPAAGLAAARDVHQRSMVAVELIRVPRGRQGDRDTGVYGMGRGHLFGVRVAVELLGGTKPDRAERRTLCARGRPALLAGARERAHRLDHPRRRRARRNTAHRTRFEERAARDASAGRRHDQPDLGDGRVWLVHDGCTDPGRRAAVFFGRLDLRRPHDGLRRLHPGAVVAPLVRRQLLDARRLAGHAASRRELPPMERRE